MKKRANGYWTYSRCREEVSVYTSKKELKSKNPKLYYSIMKNKWHDLTHHLKSSGNRYKRLIYVYEFENKSCYVGLTGNIEKRNSEHLSQIKSSVFKYIQETKLNPNLVIKTDLLDVDESVIMESKILKDYKDKGWFIINKNETGAVGHGIIKWDFDSCLNESLKYEKIGDFIKKSFGAYSAAKKNNWLVYFHFDKSKSWGYWNNKDMCFNESKKFKNRTEFRINCWAGWKYSLLNGWLDEFFQKKEVV